MAHERFDHRERGSGCGEETAEGMAEIVEANVLETRQFHHVVPGLSEVIVAPPENELFAAGELLQVGAECRMDRHDMIVVTLELAGGHLDTVGSSVTSWWRRAHLKSDRRFPR